MGNSVVPQHMWHHGYCDVCGQRCVMVYHWHYDTQMNMLTGKIRTDYRVCIPCLMKVMKEIKDDENEMD